MQTRRRHALTVLTTLPAGLALALTGVLPAQADDTTYVALGDSFSAGTGTRASTDDCYRSPYGYPALIAQSQGLNLDYQACSGATTADVLNNQVSALSTDTDLVTMTIGGNDLGFADVITECALPGWLSNCNRAIDGGLSVLRNQLPSRYDAVLAAIDSGAPNADVRVGGYPLLFNGQDCNALTFFSSAEMSRLNAATNELDTLVKNKTSAAGHTFVDPRGAFAGHAVCDNPEWINGLSWPIVESFHPNRDGNLGYADLFWTGAGANAAATVPTDRATQGFSSSIQAQAEAVLAMDLTSPAALRAAAKAGVSPERISTLVEQLRTGDRSQVSRALAQLSELDAQYEARHAARH